MKMMKYSLLLVVLLVVLLATVAIAGPEESWFDLENCAMCKNLMTDMELFESMTWETHKMSTGMLDVTTFPAEMKERYDTLMKTMEATGQRMMEGEKLPMCGMCNSYGGLMMAGADMEMIETDGGTIGLISSQDPKVVAMIHKHAETTITEFAKWTQAETAGHDHGHEGHDHAH